MQPQNKLLSIQILRGLAAILVVMYHSSTLFAKNINIMFFANIFKFAHVGVDFFFVLSGFIIYYVHHNDFGKPLQLKKFFFKRFTRIYPVYWCVLFPRLIFNPPNSIFSIICAILLFPYPNERIVNVSWTLTYEIFFYLFFGLIIYYGYRKIIVYIIVYLSALFLYFIISLFTSYYESYFLLNFHLFEFLEGIFCAYLFHNGKSRIIYLYIGLFLFLFFGVLANRDAIYFSSKNHLSLYQSIELYYSIYEKYSFIFFGIPSLLIILGAASIKLSANNILSKVFIFLGEASFSIYLIHGTVINKLLVFFKYTNLKLALELAIPISSILIGSLFYLFVEKNILFYFQRRSKLFFL